MRDGTGVGRGVASQDRMIALTPPLLLTRRGKGALIHRCCSRRP